MLFSLLTSNDKPPAKRLSRRPLGTHSHHKQLLQHRPSPSWYADSRYPTFIFLY